MKSGPLTIGFTLLVLASSLGSLPAGAQDETGSHGGDLVVALKDFLSLDPTVASQADRKVLDLVYDTLGRIDPVTLRFVPWAATGWAHDGSKNITVTLRNDLRFDDGLPYDADAVVRSLNTYTKGGVQRWSVVKVDELTVRFDFTAIDATWNYRTNNEAGPGLFFTEGLSAHVAWDASGGRKYSGPFRVEREDPTALRLAPNVYHFTGRPNLDSITYRWPYTLEPDGSGRSVANDAGCALLFQEVHLIGWSLQAKEMTTPRDCVANFGGFLDDPLTLGNESLRSIQNPDQNLTMPHVGGAKNPGTDLLYYGFSYNAASAFVGSPGAQGQKLRSSIYTFVNRALYRLFESQSVIAHGPQHQLNTPWSPESCDPFRPCNTIVEASTVRAPPPANQRTDTDPGIQALNDAGILDRDGDGWREMATGEPLTISILAPSFSLDTPKKAMADDLRGLAASAQLNVTTVLFDTWADLDAAVAACTTSCLYIRRYVDATQTPDWIYQMPEVRNANDPIVDTHLNRGASASFTQSSRSLEVGYVSHHVGANADFLPLMHFDSLEGFDMQSFTGWVDTFGGINNFWTFLDLRLMDLGGLHVRASAFPVGLHPDATGVARGVVTVVVRDDAGSLVPDADVHLSSLLPSVLETDVGRTDAEGTFRVNYATTGVANVTDDVVSILVTKRQYAGARTSTSLTVHPAVSASLRVSVTRGSSPEIAWNGSAPLVVTVEDSNGVRVPNARVVLRTDHVAGTIVQPNGMTGGNGTYQTQFLANAGQGVTVRIIAEVSAAGYDSAASAASLAVRGNPGVIVSIPRIRNVPGFEAAAVIGAVALTFVLSSIVRRRREE